MRRKLVVLLIVCWTMAVSYGLHALMLYKGKAGSVGGTPEIWPRNELLNPSPDKPQLVMFAHPMCPCTRASLGELELLAAQAKGKFDAAILFYQPEGKGEAWSKTASIDVARSIPGVRVILDKDGHLASRFGAETSGHTFVYAPNGKLIFSGGITGSRGHLGANGGFDSVLHLISNGSIPSQPTTAKVFGCGLFDRCTNSQTAETR